MFSESNNQCGKLCESNRPKRSALNKDYAIKTGWTPFYMNADHPNGTGDHEHYTYYISGDHDRLTVYGSDGQAYTNCEKKAIHVRERGTQLPWWTLATSYTLLFSKFKDEERIKKTFGVHLEYSGAQTNSEEEKENDQTYSTSLKPDYG